MRPPKWDCVPPWLCMSVCISNVRPPSADRVVVLMVYPIVLNNTWYRLHPVPAVFVVQVPLIFGGARIGSGRHRPPEFIWLH